MEEFAKVIEETLDRGGNVVIPAFAVGRTQDGPQLYQGNQGKTSCKGAMTISLSTSTALWRWEATAVFKENMMDCYNDETKALIKKGINLISFGLRLSSYKRRFHCHQL